VEVPAIELRDLTIPAKEEASTSIRERVIRGRMIQLKRLAGEKRITCNARLTSRLIRKHCALDAASLDVLNQAMSNLSLSARAYDRILKVARTIADLAGASWIQADHVAEAVRYRTLDRIFGKYGAALEKSLPLETR